MHATELLNNYLSKYCQGVHKTRMIALLTTTKALMTGKKLTVTGLGRTTNKTPMLIIIRIFRNIKMLAIKLYFYLEWVSGYIAVSLVVFSGNLPVVGTG